VTIYFYGADEVPYGCFSNFSAHGFDRDGRWWPTSEHYFQAQKFAGTRHADLIRRAATPLRAAQLGRDRSRPLRRDWDRVKDDVMRRAVAAKFVAHADIRVVLLGTGDEEIVEDTDTDHYWGRGRSGAGRNMLGRILMRTRTRLRADQAHIGVSGSNLDVEVDDSIPRAEAIESVVTVLRQYGSDRGTHLRLSYTGERINAAQPGP
jgi:ribA/ribD-fused uncharacterized protein